jgi:hypothetical protein
MWFCEFLSLLSEEDFLHLVCSDEFYVYVTRRPNHQNDRIWGRSIAEIDDQERIREMPASPDCIGVFICFSIRAMLYVIKPFGQSWNGDYFRNIILLQHTIPFLQDPQKVLDPNQVTFLHDRAPCMKALQTQQLLEQYGVDFFGNQEWPGNSPDLNACEHLGSILKDRCEAKMIERFPNNIFGKDELHLGLVETLEEMSNEVQLFSSLLRSYPRRLQAVREANGGHTDY